MLIPQECHKDVVPVPVSQARSRWVPISIVPTLKQGFGARHHEEKAYLRKRRFRFVQGDETTLSEEVDAPEARPDFDLLLRGLLEAY